MKKSIGSGRGSVYNIILKALQSGDKYGYEICKEVEEKTNGAYILKQPSLYSGLKRLEAQGDIKSYWKDSALGGRRHYYSLTETGRERIESSDFNWQDARDDIIDALFEKSDLEKTIESAESDLDYIKTKALNEKTQKDIDDILNSTEYLANKSDEKFEIESDTKETSEKNLQETKNKDLDNNEERQAVDYSAGDLFSMFNTVAENEERKDEEINENNDDEIEEENVQQKILETPEQNEEDIQENQNITDAKIEKENSIKEDKNIKQINEETKNKQLDLFSFFNNSQTYKENIAKNGHESLEENKIENKDEHKFSDIENNLKTIEEEFVESDKAEFHINDKLEECNSNINNDDLSEDELKLIFEDVKDEDETSNTTLNNNIDNEENADERIVLEKNENDVFEEYRKNNLTFGTNLDNSSKEETFDKTLLFKYENQSANQNISEENKIDELKSTIEEKNSQLQDDDVDNIIENIKNEDEVENIENEKTNETIKEPEQPIQEESSVDYKNIFGDLISHQSVELDKNAEIDDDFVYNNTNISQSSLHNQQEYNKYENLDISMASNDIISQELPRNNEAIKDINRTLMFDTNNKKEQISSSNNFEKYDQTPFMDGNGFNEEKSQNNPFEKYDTYEKIDQVKYQSYPKNETNYDYQNKKISNLSFDKKYANAYNKFEVPDYEVRYFRKNNLENSASKFISINKLNLTNSFILSILMCIVTTICLIVSSLKSSVSGFQMFVYIASYLICFTTLIVNFFKYHFNKSKKVQKIKKPESMYLSFIAIVMITLSIAINLLAGMNFNNIAGYLASFVLPMFYACILLINYPLKKFLSKFASFYNN